VIEINHQGKEEKMRNPEFERIKKFLQEQVDEGKAQIYELFVASALIATGQLAALMQFFLEEQVTSQLSSQFVEAALDSLFECGEAPRNEFKRLAELLSHIHDEHRWDIAELLELADTPVDVDGADMLAVSAAWCLIMVKCQKAALTLEAGKVLFEHHGSSMPPNVKALFLPLFENVE